MGLPQSQERTETNDDSVPRILPTRVPKRQPFILKSQAVEGREDGSRVQMKQEVFDRAVYSRPTSYNGSRPGEVTVLPETIYQKLSTRTDLQDVSNWLKVYGANGLEIPYVGYTKLDIDLLGFQLSSVGVLISQTTAGSAPHSNGLLGSNVLQNLWSAMKEKYGQNYLQCAQEYGGIGWANALFTYDLEEAIKPQTGFTRVSAWK